MTPTARYSILVVDDEADILISLRALLRKDYDFHAAQSGYEALQVLQRQPIHVVMADQRMPGMTGVDFLARAAADYPDVVRLVFTGYADIKMVIEAINRGQVFRYINKPWDSDDLLLVLREACQHYEEAARRRQLLHDVTGCLQQCLALLKRLPEASDDAARPAFAAETEQLTQSVTTLLEQLEQAS